jgi:hypothetical protein
MGSWELFAPRLTSNVILQILASQIAGITLHEPLYSVVIEFLIIHEIGLPYYSQVQIPKKF